MEATFRILANYVALFTELACVLCIALGTVTALWRTFHVMLRSTASVGEARRVVYSGFAAWLILALEFALAADIVRTAIAPSWTQIGMLAAIAAIRTGLNWFLTRDLFEMEAQPDPAP